MNVSTGTLTLVFTDIEDSAAASERFRAAFEPTRAMHFSQLRASLEHWHGREIKSAGDSLFLVFDSASAAVQWAIQAQHALFSFAWPEPVGAVRVRMGLHTGEPFLSPDPQTVDYFGPAVNRAARVMGAAHGGQILISDTTRSLIQAQLPAEIHLLDMGVHRLKGVGEERLWQAHSAGLPDRFPPLLTLNPTRHNLPVPSTPYIGREREVLAWYALLTGEPLIPDVPSSPAPAVRLLTLTAFGGMGKTRTALHLAELCVGRYAHGVCWVELEGAKDREELLLRVCQALRLDLSAGRSLQDQALTFLRERHLLMVLDNAEGIQDVVPLVRDLLQAAPALHFLVTSRRALELRGETVVEVRPLPDREAQRLFVERARASRDDFELTEENAADVAELCLRLEGVPLAVELAAARIAGLTPRQMLPRLNERFKLLQSRAPDLPPRQRALRAAIDWSYDMLQQDERDIFAQLGVFAGGFTMEDAEAVCEGFDVFESVLELRRHSFFRVETDTVAQQDRFVMLDSLREYALERLRDLTEGEAVHRRHAAHFLRFAREQTAQFRHPQEAVALRSLARNEENMRAALEWSSRSGQVAERAELALRLGLSLQRRGYRAQAIVPVQEGLDSLAPERARHANLHLELLCERAGLALEMGETDVAARMAAEARVQAEQTRDARRAGQSENLLGRAAMDNRDAASARTHFQAAIQMAQATGDTLLQGIAYNNMGLVECRDATGDRLLAEQYLRDALEIRRTQRDGRGVAESLCNLGVLAFERQEWDAAQAFYGEALDLERQLDHLFGIAALLSNLGEVAMEREEGVRACRLFAASERLMREIGSPLAENVAAYLEQAAARFVLPWDAYRREACGLGLADLPNWALKAECLSLEGT